MSRTFNGSAGSDQQIILDVGAIVGDGGPITVLTLWRPADQNGGVLVTGIASAASTWGYIEGGDGDYYVNGDFSGATLVDAGEWQVIGYSKASGSTAVRWHFRDSAGTWTHVDGASIPDQGAPTTVWIGNGQGDLGGLRLDGDWVCSALWDSELSDGAVEAAGSLTALQDWADASPDALWDADQASTSDPVVDRTGGGADEISAPSTGNPPPVGGTDPPGWSYTISSGVTGTLAETEAADTLAASGTAAPPPVTGTVAVTEQADTLAGSGTFTPPAITGSLAETEADDTLSAAGTVTPPPVTGSLAVTEQDDQLAAAGTATPPPVTGTLAITEQDDALAAAGTSTAPGTFGSLAVTEADDILSAAGTFTLGAITGTVSITEAADVLAAAGTVDNSGVVAPTPAERTLTIPAESRRLAIAAEPRTLTIPAEDRRLRVH